MCLFVALPSEVFWLCDCRLLFVAVYQPLVVLIAERRYTEHHSSSHLIKKEVLLHRHNSLKSGGAEVKLQIKQDKSVIFEKN